MILYVCITSVRFANIQNFKCIHCFLAFERETFLHLHGFIFIYKIVKFACIVTEVICNRIVVLFLDKNITILSYNWLLSRDELSWVVAIQKNSKTPILKTFSDISFVLIENWERLYNSLVSECECLKILCI